MKPQTMTTQIIRHPSKEMTARTRSKERFIFGVLNRMKASRQMLRTKQQHFVTAKTGKMLT